MKKFYIAAAMLALTTITVNAQENLIENGDFENWTGANPENFDEVGTTVLYNDLITKETTISVTGNSVKQQSKAQGTTQYLEYGELIEVTPGHSYTISYSYLDNDTAARTRLWSSWLDASNTALATDLQASIQEADYSADGSAWVNKTLTVTAPAGAAKLRYQIRAYHQDGTGGGYIYYDNLSLVDNSVMSVKSTEISGLKMYPNPLTGNVLNITSDSNLNKDVTVFDVLGKQVLAAKVVNGTVNVSGLTSGIYIVKITEEGKTATKKLVVR